MQRLMSIIDEPLKLLGQYGVKCVIIGGVASTIYGCTILTNDLDVCHARDSQNLERLAQALQSVNAKLRNAPPDLPFLLDANMLRNGLNFTFATDIGSLDLLGEVRGVGFYEDVVGESLAFDLFGYSFPVIEIHKLILAKRTAGRGKDLLVVAELEAILERQSKLD